MAKPKIKVADDFMQTARERYALALAADAEDRAQAEEDVDFVDGQDNKQWRPAAVAHREKFRQPILTWNRLPTFVAQVVNTGRENKPAISTSPMDGGTKETSDFFESRIRHLEYETSADIAYDTARRQQVVSGRGFVRLATEFKAKSFDQRALIKPIENQFSVLWDPSAREYDRSDADWCFVFSWTSKDAYERKHGKDTAAAGSNYFASGETNPAPDWIGIGPGGDMIQEAEYWVREHDTRTLCEIGAGMAIYKDELPEGFDESQITDEREDDVVTVRQYLIDGVEVLDETEFLVPFIPIVPFWGETMVVKGRPRTYSLVRNAKDPQRLVNLYVSNIAAETARMSKTPYIVAEGQIAGREQEWEDIYDDPRAVIQYKAKDVNGNLVGKPARDAVEPPIQALTLGLNQAIDAMKAAMGIFDAALGAQSNETSGTAIERRKQQTSVATFHFGDNEARSRKRIGIILMALIKVLDAGQKEVPVRGKDGKTKPMKVGQNYRDDKTGKVVRHDLDVGDYDVAVATAPSYTSQRQEANDAYGQIARADKNFMTIAGDLYFRTSDMPGADAIADRYEKMLPPQLKPPDPNANGQAQMQQAQQQLQQLGAQHQQLVATVHQLMQEKEAKLLELQSRERIAEMQEATKLAIAEITAKSQTMERQQADRLADLDIKNSMMDRAHEAALATVDHQHDAASQIADHQQAQTLQQQPEPQQQQPQPEAAA